MATKATPAPRWSPSNEERHYSAHQAAVAQDGLDEIFASWERGPALELNVLADEGAAIRGRVVSRSRPSSGLSRPSSAHARRPASATAAAGERPSSQEMSLSKRRPASAHPTASSGTLPPLPRRPRSALENTLAKAPPLHIPEEFLEMLKQRAIHKVALDSQGLRPADAEVLANFIARDRVVTELELSRNHLGAEGAVHLARAIAGTPLTLLDLSETDICHSAWPGQDHVYSPEALDELMDSLPESSVATLDLSMNSLTGKNTEEAIVLQGVHCVARALAAPAGCPLRRLCLAHNRLGDEGAALLGAALQRRSWLLHTLELPYCSLLCGPGGERAVKTEGLAQIMAALASNRALRTLDLGGNEIGSGDDQFFGGGIGSGVEVIAQCINGNGMPTLAELRLDDNDLTYGDECRLSLALMANHTLERLDVSTGRTGESVHAGDKETQLAIK